MYWRLQLKNDPDAFAPGSTSRPTSVAVYDRPRQQTLLSRLIRVEPLIQRVSLLTHHSPFSALVRIYDANG